MAIYYDGKLTADNLNDLLIAYVGSLGINSSEYTVILKEVAGFSELTEEILVVAYLNSVLSDVVECEDIHVEGKRILAEAITSKGVSASADDSWLELSNKISSITQVASEVPMAVPTWTVGTGTITATCDTKSGVFTQFRVNEGTWQDSNVFNDLEGGTIYKFEGKYGVDLVSAINVTTPKANQAAPTAQCTVSEHGKNSAKITAPTGAVVYYNGLARTNIFTITGDPSSVHNVSSLYPATTKLNQSTEGPSLEVTLKGPGFGCPGPEHLLQGNMESGYFGTFTGICTPQVLISTLNAERNGATYKSTETITWFKFAYKGYVHFIANMAVYGGVTLSVFGAGKQCYASQSGLDAAELLNRQVSGALGTIFNIDGSVYSATSPSAREVNSMTSQWNTLTDYVNDAVALNTNTAFTPNIILSSGSWSTGSGTKLVFKPSGEPKSTWGTVANNSSEEAWWRPCLIYLGTAN